MKKIRAYNCVRTDRPNSAGSAICILLDEAHAAHTLRTFLRGQDNRVVLELMPVAEVLRLVGKASAQSSLADDDGAA
jgi:hypothetical protein